jgi:hypothetical protein
MPQWHDASGRVNLDNGLGRAGFMHTMDFRHFDSERTAEVSLARTHRSYIIVTSGS